MKLGIVEIKNYKDFNEVIFGVINGTVTVS